MKNLTVVQGQEIEKGKAYGFLLSKGFDYTRCDINAFPGDINPRWCERTIEIPAGKRGNLSKFAGKECTVITETVASNGGARINFYIKAN